MKTSVFQLSILAAFICCAFQIFAAEPAATGDTKKAESAAEPFAFADFTWSPSNYAPPTTPMATKYFTPELRLDTTYNYEFSQPADHTISGSSEVFRSSEFQITQIGVGGDFNYENVGFRLMTQFGMYSTTTPRNDASPARGQWQLDNAYRYISEAYGTYHLNALNGVNIQAGIFMSYIGLWSYYNFDNWTYQPSFVSSNTPWFFNGMRVQFFPSDKLKIEPWLINGWQSYGMFYEQPGVGVQILWKPVGWFTLVSNDYWGEDNISFPGAHRVHTDDSVTAKYHDSPSSTVSKAAMSFTFDGGCEYGGGIACGNQFFLGAMAYNRLWFDHDHYGFTAGGGAIRNPGRYLVLTPPVDGATNATGAGPYFTTNYGDTFTAWDMQLTGDYMPTRNVTFRFEYNHRWANVPYFAGHGGLTPQHNGSATPTNDGQAGNGETGWSPDLVQSEDRLTAAMLIRL